MFLIIGLLVVFGSIIGGFLMHHGHLAVLIQLNEFLIIGGAALGSFLVSNPPWVLKKAITETMGLLKPDPYKTETFAELLQVLFEMLALARKSGLPGLEPHIEEPEKSEMFKKYAFFAHHHHGMAYLTDTLKVMLTGSIEDHYLSDILDSDLERQHAEHAVIPAAINKVGDALPGFGIVAAVLGVIITMGSIGGAASEIGEKVAAALVGTFLGILLSYGVFAPIAAAIEGRQRSEHAYMLCIRQALLCFARGDTPMQAVEFARRNIEPQCRPSFADLEGMTRRKS